MEEYTELYVFFCGMETLETLFVMTVTNDPRN